MTELNGDERAELERLRRESAAFHDAQIQASTEGGADSVHNGHPGERSGRGGNGRGGNGYGRNGWTRGGRWVAAVVVLVLAGVSGSLAVVSVYLRGVVLNTDTYVETVRTAVAARLTDEIVTRTDLEGLTNELADKLVAAGAPDRVTDLVGPLVGGMSSFMNSKINELMTTQQFEDAWLAINRAAHQGLVTALVGGKGQVVTSEGYTVTIDLGVLLSLAKQQLVQQGFTIVGKIPDVSIPYTLVESPELPKIRTYTKLLDAVGTWLPWAALALFGIGILIAPNRRRGILFGALLTGVLAALTLAGITFARTYYVDNLPPDVKSPEAASVVITTVLRYLVAALQTLVVAMLVLVVGAFLAGPAPVAFWFRKGLNWVLDGLAWLLRRTGGWAAKTGHALAVALRPLRIVLVLAAAALLVAANQPGVPAVLWTTFAVVMVLALLEVFVRAERVAVRAG
jgi:hypothetical protein